MTTSTRTTRADAVCVGAADVALDALLELVPAADVGEHLGNVAEAERVVTHLFGCERAGYRGWRWSVTVARAPRAKDVTVDEVVLLPGDEAIVAPEWLPYRDRLRPGDVGPGDLLPTEDDDPRLVPGFFAGDQMTEALRRDEAVRDVVDEVGLGRPRVLSLEGRDDAAQRWYDGDPGPDSEIAKVAPATCRSCGFLVRMAGPLATLFGVCANGMATDDGRVVSFDHGCGAHSQVSLGASAEPQPLPPPVFDTVGYDDVDAF
ncbi:MAG: DUF3027 domain-containing protein [Nocardioidaceae bacterium]